MAISIAVSLLAVALRVWAAQPDAGGIEKMREVVNVIGMEALLAHARGEGLAAPAIPSAWHIEHRCPPGEKAQALAARGLGREVLERIDARAPEMREEPIDALLPRVRTLVEVADWLGATEGYGNLILAGRARDVAVVGLGRLVADLTVQLPEVAALVRRCRASYDAPLVRVRVLNAEIGSPLFPEQPGVTDEEIRARWDIGHKKVVLQRRMRLPPEVREAARREWGWSMEDSLRKEIRSAGFDPETPDPDDVFFEDELCPLPRTTANCWDVKQHERFVLGLWPSALRSVEALLTFREAVGDFPTKPKKRVFKYTRDTAEAFREAWEPHRRHSSDAVDGTAAAAFEAIRAGRLMDKDTVKQGVGGRQETPSPPPIARPTGRADS